MSENAGKSAWKAVCATTHFFTLRIPSKPNSGDGLSLSTYDFIMAPSTLFLLLKIVCCDINSFIFIAVFDYLYFYVIFFLHFEFV